MKKVFALALSIMALTACGSKTVYVTSTEVPNSPETTVTVVKTTDAPIATAAPEPTYTTEDEFIYDIETSYDGTIYLENQDMIDAGNATCDGLRSGMSGYDVLDVILSSSGGVASVEELLGTVVASAVVNFCPEQQWKFNE
jgi:hypothetical protein